MKQDQDTDTAGRGSFIPSIAIEITGFLSESTFSFHTGNTVNTFYYKHTKLSISNRKYCSYFRKDMECDFVIKDGAKVTQVMQVCVEIHDENIDREILGLLEAMKEFKLSTGSIITLHQEDTLKRNGKNIIMIPFQKWVSV